jgi:hypothetical protein
MKLDYAWDQVMYYMYEQDFFTQEYNRNLAKNIGARYEEYRILPIRTEVELAAKQLGVPDGVFISESFPNKPKKKRREVLRD